MKKKKTETKLTIYESYIHASVSKCTHTLFKGQSGWVNKLLQSFEGEIETAIRKVINEKFKDSIEIHNDM